MLATLMLALLTVALTAAVAGYIGEELLVPRLARKYGLYGVDVNKPWKPRIPETGGIAILSGLLASSAVIAICFSWKVGLGLTLTSLWLWAVGFLDDRFKLNPIVKPLLTFVAAVPVLLLHLYTPRPTLPFVGTTRLTIVYPYLLALGVGVSANMFNMIDGYNGLMAGSALIVVLGMIVASLVRVYCGSPVDVAGFAAAIAIAVLLALHLAYNWYPARVLNGDSGSLLVGGYLVLVAALLRLEAIYIIATMPLILNGFSIIASVKGFKERREMPRPTIVDECGLVRAKADPKAPITLVRLLTAREPLTELEIVVSGLILVAFSTTLALLTLLITH